MSENLEIRATAEMRLHSDADVDVIRKCCRLVSERTLEHDSGTLAHNYYLNEEAGILVSHEHYADAKSMADHIKNMDLDALTPLLESVDLVDNRVFGDHISDELLEIMKGFGETRYFPYLSGFTR